MVLPDVVVGNPVLEVLFVGVMLLSAVMVYITVRSLDTEGSPSRAGQGDTPEDASQ